LPGHLLGRYRRCIPAHGGRHGDGDPRDHRQTADRRFIVSDETTTRINTIIHWQWIFLSTEAVLYRIARSRARNAAEKVRDGHQRDVWIWDRYAGQQELDEGHQICLAYVPRDVQYAIDCGDWASALKAWDHQRWAIRTGKRPSILKDTPLAA